MVFRSLNRSVALAFLLAVAPAPALAGVMSWLDGGVDSPPMPPAPAPSEPDAQGGPSPFRAAPPEPPAPPPTMPAVAPTITPTSARVEEPGLGAARPTPRDVAPPVVPMPEAPRPPAVHYLTDAYGRTWSSPDPAWLQAYVASLGGPATSRAAPSSTCGPGGCLAPARRGLFGR